MTAPDPKAVSSARARAESKRAERDADALPKGEGQSWPIVGTLGRQHPAAKRLQDFQDEAILSRVLCDEHLTLDEALMRVWEDDRHLVTYRIDADTLPLDDPKHEYAFARVSKRSPFVEQLEKAGGRVRVTTLVFDFDREKVDGVKQRWTEESLEAHVATIQAAEASGAIPELSFFYDTAHGSRLGFVLSEEVSQLDAEAMCRGLIAQFADAGIALDSACTDFTRLFRLALTTREDTGEPYEPDYLLLGEARLDPATCPRLNVSAAERFAEADPYQGDMPDPDEVRALLEKPGKGRKPIESDLVKDARKYLQGREAEEVIFKDRALAVGEENWNSQATRIVGQTVGMLARQESATPEGIYALLHSAVEQLQYREDRGAKAADWYETVWSLVCRMWANEEAQIMAERQEREAKIAEARDVRQQLVAQIREARPGVLSDDDGEAEQQLLQEMIASDGRRHYVRRADGSFNIHPVTDPLLIPMIRDLGMEETIPTTEIRGKQIVQRSASALLNDHAKPIVAIRCSAREPVAFIDGPAGGRVLNMPVHRLNPKLEPGGRYHEGAAGWLHALLGAQHDRGVEWLAHSLDVKRPICALNLYGSPGTGKGMLAAGLAECFEGEHKNDGRALGKFNLGLLDSPIVNCDEGVPNMSSDESLPVDQAFRALVTGGGIAIRAMHRDPFNADIYPRILFTSNDRDIMRSIIGRRDLTAEDIQAIELRLLSIEVGEEAAELLSSRGGYEYTRGWVAGEQRSEYVLANHIYFLYCKRTKPKFAASHRLLVEGPIGEDGALQEHFRNDPAFKLGVRIIVRTLQSQGVNAAMRDQCHLDGADLYFMEGLFEPTSMESSYQRPSARRIDKALLESGIAAGRSEGRRTIAGRRGRWRHVARWTELREAASDLGIDVSAIDRHLGRRAS